MKKILVMAIMLFSAGILNLSALTALDIVEKADESFKAERVYSVSSLTVFRGGKAQPVQRVEGYSMEKDGKSYSLNIYRSPNRMKGTAMLTIDNDLWVRFASTGRVRKLSSSAKKNSAGGSDFSYADMGESGSGLLGKYEPELTGKKSIGGVECYVVKLQSKNGDAPYEKLIVYIAVRDYRYIRIEYFEDTANIKTMNLYEYRMSGGINYPFRIVMESHVKDSRTEIVTEVFEPDSSKVQERYFTVGYLKSLR